MEKASILIVEDEAIIAMELESQLQSLGYEVTSIVNTGEKAIENAEADKPDLMLMDIRIKGEMDGIEAAEVIRNRFGIPVIFSTAYLDEERIERAKITMPFGYVLKPIQERDLKVTIQMALYVAKVDVERKKTEEALKENRELLRTTLESTTDGILVVDQKGDVLHKNSRFAEMWRIPESILDSGDDNTLIEFILSQLKDPNAFLTKVKHLYEISDENFDTLEFIDGRYFDRLSRPLMRNDAVAGRVWSFRDITERKQAEETLRKSEGKYRSVVNNANETIYVIQDGVIEYSNPKTSELTEYTEEELNNRPISELIHAGDLQTVLSRHQQRQNGELFIDIYSHRIITKSGKVKWVEIKPIAINWENNPAVLVFASDITKRKQVEDKLKESEKRFYDLVFCSADWIWEVDKDGKFTYVSEKVEDILGYRPDEVIGKTSYDLMPKEEAARIESIFKKISSEKKTIVDAENWNLTKDGKAVCLLTNGVPIFDDEGNYLGYRGVDKDITAFKNTEKVT